jgi:type III secretory pathway component EscV
MECPLLDELRTDMWRDLCRGRVPGTLLFNQLLQEPKAALLVAEFMLKTGLLPQFKWWILWQLARRMKNLIITRILNLVKRKYVQNSGLVPVNWATDSGNEKA